MRRWISIVALVLASTAVWWALRYDSGDSLSRADATSSEPETPKPVALEPAPTVLETMPAVAQRHEAPAPTSTTAETAAKSWPRAIVSGRVVDETGAPVAGAVVRMNTVGSAWAEGQEVPVVEREGWKLEEFAQETTDLGTFRLDVPLPTSDWISLHVDTSDYLGRVSRNFGEAGGRNEPRLVEGENALGDLSVAITGAIEGRVAAEDGSKLTRATVRLDGVYPGGLSVHAYVRDDGTYTLGHVPAGTFAIEALCNGYLTARVESVTVRTRETTRGVDVRLARAPSISGIVVDEAGAPVAKARVWGWPRGSGQGAGATSRADGTFTIYLPQDEPYTLEIEDHAGFEPWGGRHADVASQFTPGANDVRIVLKRATRTTFVVLDAESGAPVTRFGIAIVENPEEGGWSSAHEFRDVEVRERLEGKVELSADPERHVVGVLSPEHAPFEGPVTHEPSLERTQVIRLARGGSITGKLERDGAALPQASVTLERDRVKIDPSKPDAEDEWFDENVRFDTGALAGRRQSITGAKDGTFRFDGLATGTYRVTVRGSGAARTVVRGVRVEAPATTSLGTLALAPSATIRGRVVVAPGASPVGIALRLGGGFDREVVIGSADGAFSFEGLEAGVHEIVVQPQPPVLLEWHRQKVTLAEGETSDVLVDLGARAPCEVRVRVVRAGKPLAGAQVGWGELRGEHRRQEGELGTSDADGRVRGLCPPGDARIFLAKSASGVVFAWTAPTTLASGASHDAVLDVVAGELEIELPDGLVPPEQGSLNAWLRDPAAKGPWITMSAATPGASFPRLEATVWDGRVVALGLVAAGEYELGVHASSMSTAPSNPNSWILALLLESAPQRITIRANETTRVQISRQ